MTKEIFQFTEKQILFRYREVVHASFDCDGDIYNGAGRVALCKEEYAVTSITPKGAWISPIGWYWRPKFKFMLAKARKRFAHDNEKYALESYVARQKRRIAILEYQLSKSRRGMALAKTKLEELENDQQQKTTEPSS
jgi:hypothetical protein